MIALVNRHSYRDWIIFDQYEIFSLATGTQAKIMLTCLLVIIPDCLCCWTDMMILLSFLRSDRYKLLQSTLRSTQLNFAFIMVGNGSQHNKCYHQIQAAADNSLLGHLFAPPPASHPRTAANVPFEG